MAQAVAGFAHPHREGISGIQLISIYILRLANRDVDNDDATNLSPLEGDEGERGFKLN